MPKVYGVDHASGDNSMHGVILVSQPRQRGIVEAPAVSSCAQPTKMAWDNYCKETVVGPPMATASKAPMALHSTRFPPFNSKPASEKPCAPGALLVQGFLSAWSTNSTKLVAHLARTNCRHLHILMKTHCASTTVVSSAVHRRDAWA
jgi:hypothetical protein